MKQDIMLENNQTLETPSMTGTIDERVEALNLWTNIVGSIQKVTNLPSMDNKVAILSFIIKESSNAIARITNNSIVMAPVHITPEVVVQAAVATEPASVTSFNLESFQNRLAQLSGV